MKQEAWGTQPPRLIIATLQNFFIHLTITITAITYAVCSIIARLELAEYSLSIPTAVIEESTLPSEYINAVVVRLNFSKSV